MRTKLWIIVSLLILVIGSSTVFVQGKEVKETKSHEGTMMGSAMVGAGFLHDHMNSMIQQMSGMIRMMSQMMGSGKMDEKNKALHYLALTSITAMTYIDVARSGRNGEY